LEGDAAPVPRQQSRPDEHGNFIADVFFKAAELKGQSLYIGQKSSGYSSACGVAYVKLIPLTDEEVDGLRADLSQPSNRKLAATCDGFSFIYDRRPTTAEELLSEVATVLLGYHVRPTVVRAGGVALGHNLQKCTDMTTNSTRLE